MIFLGKNRFEIDGICAAKHLNMNSLTKKGTTHTRQDDIYCAYGFTTKTKLKKTLYASN